MIRISIGTDQIQPRKYKITIYDIHFYKCVNISRDETEIWMRVRIN
jgi:hypothetical protein